MTISVEPFGDAALRASLPDGVDGRALGDALRTIPRVIDALVTERHALVTFDPAAPPEGIEEAIAQAVAGRAGAATTRVHTIDVRYDGPDLDDVARSAKVSCAEVIALHTGREYTVSAIGFLPGFAYLREIDPRLAVPRRASPRPRVTALSVAIAGPYTGVYPFASPGGWHLLGTAIAFSPFDPRAGATLAVGDRVVFAEARR